jgi:hypothetical protein
MQIAEVDESLGRFVPAQTNASNLEPGRLQPLGLAHSQRRSQQQSSRQESASAEDATFHKLFSIEPQLNLRWPALGRKSAPARDLIVHRPVD